MENKEHPVKAWLRATGRKQGWLAAQIGLNAGDLSENLSGKSVPVLRTKLAIQAISGNAVMASEWPVIAKAKGVAE